MNKKQITTIVDAIESLKREASNKSDNYAYLENWKEANWQGGKAQAYGEVIKMLKQLL